MDNLMKLSCEEFLEKLASKEPVPGGGGAAALGGAISAALASMVANLTLGKEKFFHKDYDETLVATYGEEYKEELVVEGGKTE